MQSVADAAGVDLSAAVAALEGTASRGRCDSAASTAAGARSVDVRIAAAVSPFLSPPRRIALAATSDGRVRLAAAADGRRCGRILCHPQAAGYLRGCSDPALLAARSGHHEAKIRQGTAENPMTPAAALTALSTDPDSAVRMGVATNPGSSVALVALLTVDADLEVRTEALYHPGCPAALITNAAASIYPDVRSAAAEASRDKSLVERLATDPERSVRMGVALNPSASVEILDRLAADPRRLVREVVTQNPSTAAETLASLANDDDRSVAGMAQRTAQQRADPSGPVDDVYDYVVDGVRYSMGSQVTATLAESVRDMFALDPQTREAAGENVARLCRGHMFMPRPRR